MLLRSLLPTYLLNFSLPANITLQRCAVFADDELHHDGPYTGGGLFSLLPSPTGQQVRYCAPKLCQAMVSTQSMLYSCRTS